MKEKFNKQLTKIMIPCLMVSFVIGFFSFSVYMIFAIFAVLMILSVEIFLEILRSLKDFFYIFFLIWVSPVFTLCVIPMMIPVLVMRKKIEQIVGEKNIKRVIFNYGIKCEVLMVMIAIIVIIKFAYFT